MVDRSWRLEPPIEGGRIVMVMEYRGRFTYFDLARVRTYPLEGRASKVHLDDLAVPSRIEKGPDLPKSSELLAVASAVHKARSEEKPVILFTGAHLVKNGFGPLVRDLVSRGLVTMVSMNAAGMIHDLELALVGATSEDVPASLPIGDFGFSEETGGLINEALTEGNRLKLGAGEALGRLLDGEPMPRVVDFPHKDISLMHGCWLNGCPLTIHAMIGTDVIDQHPAFDPEAKGGCSGRDFLVFAAHVCEMDRGGVFLNIGSAVAGPEVFLKACSLAANIGRAPRAIETASFDFRPGEPTDAGNERRAGYYYRDLKSVVVRIPESFSGHGHYVQGDHLQTVPAFYQALVAPV
jgi:hypothetical protein